MARRRDDPEQISLLRTVVAPALFTIGYDGRTVSAYLGALGKASVTVLADVRRNAVSRFPGFAKGALAAACAGAGIRYEHLPELGVPRALRQAGSRAEMLDAYAAQLPAHEEAIARVASWLRSGERVAIGAMERRGDDCHRSRLAALLAARTGLVPGDL